MFTMALFPLISRQIQSDPERSRRFYALGLKILITLALPTSLLTTLAAREMVLVLAGAEYLPGAMTALQLIIWSMPISWANGLTQYVLIALNQQRYLTRAYLIGFGFTLVSNLALMSRFGYQASALLHILAELALFIPFMIGIRRHMGGIDWRQIIGKPALAALGAGAIALALLNLHRGLALVGAIVVYLLLAWRLGILTPEEQASLAPILRKS
jgi:O-antigen/teichoic acid export membrane protein